MTGRSFHPGKSAAALFLLAGIGQSLVKKAVNRYNQWEAEGFQREMKASSNRNRERRRAKP